VFERAEFQSNILRFPERLNTRMKRSTKLLITLLLCTILGVSLYLVGDVLSGSVSNSNWTVEVLPSWVEYYDAGEEDPYKELRTPDCPKVTAKLPKVNFTGPTPNATIDMHAYYPDNIQYPPLLGNMTIIAQYEFEVGPFVGSPSILRMDDGEWIASFDVKIDSTGTTATAWETQIWSSKDRGITWQRRTSIRNLTWGSLFTVNKEIYIIGAGNQNTRIVISKMKFLDSWSKPVAITSLSLVRNVHTGNVGVLVTEDFVQTSIKNGREGQLLYVLYANHKTDDLLKPWKLSNGVQDPLKVHKEEIADLLNIEYTLTEEGVMVPYGEEHAQVIFRVNNEEICGLTQRYLWNYQHKNFTFLRLSVDPGWSTAHGYVVFDPPSELYWMVSHYGRDSRRDILDTALWIPPTRACEVDRSILGLYYNRGLSSDWHLAGFVSYSPDWAHHASYPFITIDGDDLIFVGRAHLGGPYNETTVNHGKRVCVAMQDGSATANNHNSNMVVFSRVSDFRQYVHPMMYFNNTDPD